MPSLQNDIEKIIKSNIEQLTGLRQQKKSLHISHQHHELLGELYHHDDDGVAFLNHFGHIEYHNLAFSRFLMLDKVEKRFNNIFNLDQLPLTIVTSDKKLIVTYPNNKTRTYLYDFKIIHFQKSILLQLKFKDITAISLLSADFEQYKAKNNQYMRHLLNPMFLMNNTGQILDVPSNHLRLFNINISKITGESIFETLPFDYATAIIEKIKMITPKIDGHFLYEFEKEKMITVYDTTVKMIEQDLYLCQIVDVSDLNTMSSTLEYLNAYDSLTGFYNTSYYEQLVEDSKDSSQMPLGIYIVSLQGLKRMNLKFGHHQCDNLLIDLALTIKSIISQHEIPCKISGDTFVVFFPNCSEETLDKFLIAMNKAITACKSNYIDYQITYAQRHVMVKDHQTPIKRIVQGLLI